MSAHMIPNYLSIGAKSNKKCCPTKRLVHHIHFDMTMQDIFLGFSEVKMHFCHYMPGKETLLSVKCFQ